ncbi:DeoR/GlpR family DNA-binding transcription regulator [Bacillus sp. B15-48]|uniref:DeoR/GlpR family DNA-binding transcription regulator n=1 Tax=Bacillus sp. B15-48 TaxID=1548601 RepID=UPI00193EF166|nr:DeoR/GlpR family DNA-binding transcription regulator [Bacillus sp. B15-48]MBM4761252.1 DeoR family transcriptional regulator [Bacillus sp. B15-48]
MLEPERHQKILEALKNKNTVKLQELVELTNSSESTIRRDLTQLEQRNLLKRVHGGAARLQGNLTEPTMTEKSSKNLQAKNQIAQFAAKLVEEGESIYLDAGSTILEMIPYLPSNIVVVTNGLTHANELLEKEIKTYLIGGFIKPTTKAMVGRGAVDSLEKYRFDKCFLGVNGIHPQYGYTTPDQEEASIKQMALSLARESFVLADESKFSEVAFAKIAELSEASIITDHLSAEAEELFISQTKIKVVTA